MYFFVHNIIRTWIYGDGTHNKVTPNYRPQIPIFIHSRFFLQYCVTRRHQTVITEINLGIVLSWFTTMGSNQYRAWCQLTLLRTIYYCIFRSVLLFHFLTRQWWRGNHKDFYTFGLPDHQPHHVYWNDEISHSVTNNLQLWDKN